MKELDLFVQEKIEKGFVPLAERMRPQNLDEFVGQEHLLAPGKALRKAIEQNELFSMIFWGPPGSGKTTLARIIAQRTGAHFVEFSAVVAGIKDVKEVIFEAEQRKLREKRTILFVDEIHRFNKAQQGAFLPHVERGTIILIGATTENPSFEVISPLLSRCRVFLLNTLNEKNLLLILNRALQDKQRGLAEFQPKVESQALQFITQMSEGDARVALNTLELAVMTTKPEQNNERQIDLATAQEAMQKRVLLYDKNGEEHYNLISALHKSLRDSDADAALYWLGRMLSAGEDPLYLARRMVRFASEDIGNADPQALQVAIAAKEAYDFLGSPEGELALAQAAIYLATAPKSNAVYQAYSRVQEEIQQTGSLPVPLVIRNAPTRLMKEIGYGKGYKYAHNFPDASVDQEHLPPELKGKKFYHPTERGFEGEIKKRMKNKFIAQ
ncbi:MAG: replication-associated recombination protein A [Candidatus Edwardsbacteria bacterium]